MFRGSAAAFATDALARETANSAIAKGYDVQAPSAIRHFFYLPLMHSEDLSDQDRCVALIAERCGTEHYSYAHALAHRDVIRRFGRFPGRNAALGRSSTAEETGYLAAHSGAP